MRKILSLVTKICKEQNLIEDGDKIAVGVSGGKDSLVLLTALKNLQVFYDKKFEIVAISIDLSNGQMDFSEVENYCKELSIPFYMKKTNIFEVIFDIRKEKNPCSLCANLRRGVLNSYARELGCNKVALGHHLDDLIETFIISLFFEGRLSTFLPSTYLSRTNITVIRPLLFVNENEISKYAENLPIVKNICTADKNTQREKAKQILSMLDKNYLNAKKKLFTAITNPERFNLWKNIKKNDN